MSTNFEVILFEQGRSFEPSCMTNAFGTLGESSGVVLCSTELSLRCVTKKNARAAPLEYLHHRSRQATLGSLHWPDRVQPPRARLGF